MNLLVQKTTYLLTLLIYFQVMLDFLYIFFFSFLFFFFFTSPPMCLNFQLEEDAAAMRSPMCVMQKSCRL